MSVYIRCKNCGHRETVDKRWFFKVIGGVMAGFGPVAWVTFLFAGTGLALPICAAILAGGVAMMAFSDEITKWIEDHYPCPTCYKKTWEMVKD